LEPSSDDGVGKFSGRLHRQAYRALKTDTPLFLLGIVAGFGFEAASRLRRKAEASLRTPKSLFEDDDEGRE
ncbi:MAG TPA: hypothetical protein VGH19_20985, partial [Verrucomicrobiae bacterium]